MLEYEHYNVLSSAESGQELWDSITINGVLYETFCVTWSCFHILQGRGSAPNNSKRHWLVEQKLLQFVDAFHQYVMDRVRNSACTVF